MVFLFLLMRKSFEKGEYIIMSDHNGAFIINFKEFDCRTSDPLIVKKWFRENLPLVATETANEIMNLKELSKAEQKFNIDKFYDKKLRFSDTKHKGLYVLFWGKTIYLFYPKQIQGNQIVCNLIPMNPKRDKASYNEIFPRDFKMNMLLVHIKQNINYMNTKFWTKWFQTNREFIKSSTIFIDDEFMNSLINDFKNKEWDLIGNSFAQDAKEKDTGVYILFRNDYVAIFKSDVYPSSFYEFYEYTKEDYPNYKYQVSDSVAISNNYSF